MASFLTTLLCFSLWGSGPAGNARREAPVTLAEMGLERAVGSSDSGEKGLERPVGSSDSAQDGTLTWRF